MRVSVPSTCKTERKKQYVLVVSTLFCRKTSCDRFTIICFSLTSMGEEGCYPMCSTNFSSQYNKKFWYTKCEEEWGLLWCPTALVVPKLIQMMIGALFDREEVEVSVSVWQTAMPWLNIQRKTCFWHLRKGVNIWNRNINDQSYLQMLACGKFQWSKNLEESGIYISWPKPWIIALVKFACEIYLFCVISYLKPVLTLRCRYKSPELKQ